MPERTHWGKFTKLKDGSEHLLANAGRKLHGLWYLRHGQVQGVSVSTVSGIKQISVDLTDAEIVNAPGDVRKTLSKLGLGPDTPTRVSLGLKRAYRGVRDAAYGFSVEIHPIVNSEVEVLTKGVHAATGFAYGRGERLLCLYKTADRVSVFTNIGPRIDESDELRGLLEPLADFLVNVVKSRANRKP